MDVEERLREKSYMAFEGGMIEVESSVPMVRIITVSDALQICNEAVTEKDKKIQVLEFLNESNKADIQKLYDEIAEAKKDGILYMAQQLFSRVDTPTWNNVIAKILEKNKIDFE